MTLVALRELLYAGKTVPMGEVFEAENPWARTLLTLKWARLDSEDAPRKRRTYRRRDLTAESAEG